jgi:hypothetical protein
MLVIITTMQFQFMGNKEQRNTNIQKRIRLEWGMAYEYVIDLIMKYNAYVQKIFTCNIQPLSLSFQDWVCKKKENIFSLEEWYLLGCYALWLL